MNLKNIPRMNQKENQTIEHGTRYIWTPKHSDGWMWTGLCTKPHPTPPLILPSSAPHPNPIQPPIQFLNKQNRIETHTLLIIPHPHRAGKQEGGRGNNRPTSRGGGRQGHLVPGMAYTPPTKYTHTILPMTWHNINISVKRAPKTTHTLTLIK
jgi:hypothetical protein